MRGKTVFVFLSAHIQNFLMCMKLLKMEQCEHKGADDDRY